MSTEQVAIQEFTLTEVFQNFSQIKMNVQNFTDKGRSRTVSPGFLRYFVVNAMSANFWTSIVGRLSPIECACQIRSVYVFRYKSSRNICYVKMAGQFAVYVHCVKARGNEDWSIKTRCQVSMTSIHGKSSSKQFDATFTNKSDCPGQGLYDFIPMDELRHNLVISDQVVLEARVEILEMTGIEMPPSLKYFDDNEAKKMSDVTLLVEDKRFHVSKFTLVDVRACMGCGGLENGVKDPEMQSSLTNIFQEIEKKIIAMYLAQYHAQFFPRL
ncbi:hypothetical protein CAEBREN_22799 [Caenorhabditis brenneri]|uniref:MATH domain-containing protein n=1 Tax=Caenorhabditis brenneri TaxID=135651 RepID=G0MD25_CAEBE|nr:hypothetical protein CAEBREN_22799 [Caenorhabditis brenneri]